MTQEWSPSIANQAASPVANSAVIPLTFKEFVDRNAAEPVALDREQLGERVGLHAGAPHDRRRVDALARAQGGALCVHCGDRDPRPGLDPECGERLGDYRAGRFAHVGTDPGLAVGEDHARPARGIGDRGAQLARHLGRGFDPGQAAADHQRGIAAGRGFAARQGCDMGVEPAAGLVGVDIEGMRVEARDRRPRQPAAEGEDQAIVWEWAPTRAQDLAAGEVDAGDFGLDALDPDRPQHLIERDPGRIEIGLVVAHPDRMPRVAVDHRDPDPVGAEPELVELSGGADRAPQPGKAGAEHDDPLRQAGT